MQCIPRRLRGQAALLAVSVVHLLVPGCHRGTADSKTLSTPQERTRWVASRISGRLPTPIVDAHFNEIESKIPKGHMGPGYSMWWLHLKIEIDPQDAPAWAARTNPGKKGVGWNAKQNPMLNEKMNWSMPPEDFEGASWYDPAPLFSTGAHGGYIGGHMIINKAGTRVYVWQHWR